MVEAPPEIITDRLVLSPPTADDATAIFERYASSPEVTRYLGWRCHRSVADTEAFLRSSEEQWRRWPAGPYMIRLRRDGQLIGGTGFGFETAHRAATGYVLMQDAWGRGYATESLRAIVDLAPRIGVETLYALCHPEHRASQHVLEKCGFVRDGSTQLEFPNLAPGKLQEAFCYVVQ